MIQFSWPYDVSMSLHARKMKKSWIFEKRYSNDFDIIRCNIRYMASFLVEKSKENGCRWYLLLFYDPKTSRESNGMLDMSIRCVNQPTGHQKDEKVNFSSNFDVYLASFLTTQKIFKNFFSRPKKTGGNLSKI